MIVSAATAAHWREAVETLCRLAAEAPKEKARAQLLASAAAIEKLLAEKPLRVVETNRRRA